MAAALAFKTLPLVVSQLRYCAGTRVLLDGLTFAAAAGEIAVILGPNGAGKTLLLRLCHGLLPPDAGSIRWNGLPPAQARRHHAMVFQRPIVLRRTVTANVAYPLAVRGVPRAERAERIRQALHAAQLDRLAGANARRLSGGEQQRLAIARAWALQPEVLLLDEPCANLDPGATHEIEAMLQAMHRRGVAIFMTTHDLAQARRLADRILFLHHGRLLEDALADDFFTRPRHADARRFLAGELLT